MSRACVLRHAFGNSACGGVWMWRRGGRRGTGMRYACSVHAEIQMERAPVIRWQRVERARSTPR